ncbi:MAG: hypothetical protein AAGK22_29045 [Acidobacteriota bacterium]
MKTRVLEEQADLFEVGVLSQSAEVEGVALDALIAEPSGAPVVIVGRALESARLPEFRRLATAAARAKVAVLLVPPFADLDIGRYFETPVRLRAQRRSTESEVGVVDPSAAKELGDEIKIRSDHHFDTALGAGVVATDQQGKPVLIRFQATNTSGPVYFSALQLLTYTALTDDGHRQAALAHMLAWEPAAAADEVDDEAAHATKADSKPPPVSREVLVPVGLLLSAGGAQASDQLRSRARALLGADLSEGDVKRALEEFGSMGVVTLEEPMTVVSAELDVFLERLGLHAYVRELADLLATEEIPA